MMCNPIMLEDHLKSQRHILTSLSSQAASVVLMNACSKSGSFVTSNFNNMCLLTGLLNLDCCTIVGNSQPWSLYIMNLAVTECLIEDL